MALETHTYRAFGLGVRSSFPLPGMTPEAVDGHAVSLRLARPEALAGLWSGEAGEPRWIGQFSDGHTFRMESGKSGDHLFRYGDEATFHLDAGRRRLACMPTVPQDLAWQRVLLDSVLFSLALLEGYEALHASAVSTPRGVVAFRAGTGGGKTSLAAEMVRRGHPLFCDDILVLGRRDGQVVAHPGPPHMNVAPERPAAGLSSLGEPITVFDDETWVAATSVARSPAPLAALFLLDRSESNVTVVEPEEITGLSLLVHALSLRDVPERGRARFELYSDIASATPGYRIAGDLGSSPSELADLVELALAEIPTPAVAA